MSLPAATAVPTVVPLRLPRAAALTDALVDAAQRRPPADTGGTAARIAQGLARAAATAGTASDRRRRDIRIGAFQVALAAGRAPPPPDDTPFRWSARTARRALGLPAVRACVEGSATSPAEAVAEVVGSLSRPGGARTGRPAGLQVPHALARWVRDLPDAARTAVAADATTWATRLWTCVDWWRLPGARVGEADEWWEGRSGAARVAVRGRADIRWEAGGGAGGPVHLSMLAGWPSGSSATELALSALVPALRPGGAVPAAVAGWWPDCGKAWVVAVDAALLDATADAVTDAVTDAVASVLPGATGTHR